MEKMERGDPEELPEGLMDAGPFIAALFPLDPRHGEAFTLVEAARSGQVLVCTTTGILSEVYAALTWHLAQPARLPQEAALIVASLVKPPSRIRILPDNLAAALKALELAGTHHLTARRIHDARHAGAALAAGISRVYTYDVNDWKAFEGDGLVISGPASALSKLSRV